MVDFIEGELIAISVLIFILGLLFQVYRFFSITWKKECSFLNLPAKKEEVPKGGAALLMDWIASLRRTVFGSHPYLITMTFLFHFFIFIVPLFVLGHNLLLKQAWGIRFLAFPESVSDGLTLVLLLCGLVFLLRRIFLKKVRVITTAYDYIVLFITLAPFITGFLAYHQWFDYRTVIFLHILSGEAMLITIPFTKLGHMIFFFLYRFFIGSEYSFLRGTRTW
jgi:nitrate reductase gamma subunit